MGSNDMPELGSRISLISKADIRYEGKLFTVDPQDCTIALANVRSFGTEDRETAHPVAAQSQVYDYILFRATDIKDISVIPNQLLYDPAIVQLSAPSNIGSSRGFGSGAGSQTSNQVGGGGGGGGPTGFNHSILGGGMGGGGGFNPMQSGLQALTSSRAPQPPPKCVLDLLTGSRSSTPGLRKVSPTVDQGIQASSRQLSSPPNKDRYRHQPQQQQQGYFRHQHGGGRSGGGGQPQRQNQPQHQQRGRDNYQGGYNQGQQRNHQQQQPQQDGGRWNNRTTGRVPMRGNNRGRPQNFSRAPGTKKPSQPLKFESDYDFDKANTEFEELRTQLAKVKIDVLPGEAAQPPVPQGQQNGEEKKDDSGNETAIGDGEGEEVDYFYNKKKSFYDNISCEAIERSKGRLQRPDWRKERKLNSETFGVAMPRRQNYRGGRGGYYQQGGRGGYYQSGNRGQGGFRTSNFRPQNKNNRQSLPMQPPNVEAKA